MRQRLGQHFLINKTAIGKAIAELDLQKGDVVVEIGPGRGILTMPLAKKLKDLSGKLIAIEKDPALVDNLLKTVDRQRLPIQIISGDALKVIPNIQLLISNWKLVGNIPYYITGHLLRIIGELENKPQITVLMIQKEVAERVTAKPPKMNLLAAATQVWADISIVFCLKPGDFNPPPEVESAIIKLKIKSSKLKIERLGDYYKFIHAAFKQPRKTLLNNLTQENKSLPPTIVGVLPLEKGESGNNSPFLKGGGRRPGDFDQKELILNILRQMGFNEKTRAQELGIEQLLYLSKNF